MKKLILSILIAVPAAWVNAQDVDVSLILGTDISERSFQYGIGLGVKGSVILLKHIHVGVAVIKHKGETKTIEYGSLPQFGVNGGQQAYKNNPLLLSVDAGYRFNIPITKSFKPHITPLVSGGYMLIKSKSSGVYGEETININSFAPGVGIAVGVPLTERLSVGAEQRNYFLHGGEFYFGEESGDIQHGYRRSIHYSAVLVSVSYKLMP